MIVFDLRCEPAGHVFEAWFGSSDAYESQRIQGLISCPLCGSGGIGKAVMAPRVGAKASQGKGADAVQDVASLDPAAVKEMLETLAAAQKKMLAASDYVGDSFADEARAIQLGDAAARSIYGRATRDQAQSLAEEGIDVLPLPFPVVEPGQEN